MTLVLLWSPQVVLRAEVAPATAQGISATFLSGWNVPAALATATAQAPSGALGVWGTLSAETATATASSAPATWTITREAHITIARPSILGYAVVGDFVGPSALTIGPPSLSAQADTTYVIHSDIVMPPPILAAIGSVPIIGVGGIRIGPLVLSGAGTVPYVGIGALVIAKPILSNGSGTLTWVITSAFVMPAPTLAGYAPPPPPGPPPPLPPTDIHIIECLDINGVLLGRVQPIRSAKFTIVENDVGDFEIELPWIYDDVINFLQPRNRIEYAIKGIKVFGGIIMKRLFHQEGRYSMVTLSGPGYNGLLTGRIVVPPPGAADDVYTNVKADDLMKNLVRNHLGANAATARQVPHFTVHNNLTASSFTTNYNGRYETVLDALKNIAKEATDTRFQVIRALNGTLEFHTYVPIIGEEHGIGTSDTVLFDMAGGNALNIEYVEDGTGIKNYVYGGGPGDDAARMIREGYNQTSIDDWGRIEEFLDQSGVKTTAELDLEILKELDETSRGGPSLTFTIGQAGRYEYPVDFKFGDRVSAIWLEAGLTLTDVISGLTINLEDSGAFTIEMSIGQPNLFRLAPGRALARFIRAIRNDVGIMQRH